MNGVSEPISIIPLVALGVSLLSLAISYAAYRRTKLFQDYDYATRIQIVDEKSVMGSPNLLDHPAFIYEANVENRGAKPI